MRRQTCWPFNGTCPEPPSGARLDRWYTVLSCESKRSHVELVLKGRLQSFPRPDIHRIVNHSKEQKKYFKTIHCREWFPALVFISVSKSKFHMHLQLFRATSAGLHFLGEKKQTPHESLIQFFRHILRGSFLKNQQKTMKGTL